MEIPNQFAPETITLSYDTYKSLLYKAKESKDILEKLVSGDYVGFVTYPVEGKIMGGG